MSQLQKWFGFNRRERRASLILIVLIIIMLTVKYLFPERKIPVEYYLIASSHEKEETDSILPVQFDPNTVSYEVLVKAGLSPGQAKNIINYREHGGRFTRPEDIYRMYTIDSSAAGRLIPYIIIGEEKPERDLSVDIARLNSAGQEELTRLPGIGSVLSVRIVRYRNLLGGYVSESQLGEVYGIGDSLADILKRYVSVDTQDIRKIKVNSAGLSELSRHPYIGNDNASIITRMRGEGQKFNTMDELLKVLEIEKPQLLKHYLDFSH